MSNNDEMEKKKVYFNAAIMGMSISKQGVAKDGKNWTLYKYELKTLPDEKKRFCSSFNKYDIGEDGYYMFIETPNPKNDKFPYLQLVKRISDVDMSKVNKELADKATEKAKSMIEVKVDIGVFKKAYVEKFGDKMGVAHFIASYLAKVNPELFKTLKIEFETIK